MCQATLLHELLIDVKLKHDVEMKFFIKNTVCNKLIKEPVTHGKTWKKVY